MKIKKFNENKWKAEDFGYNYGGHAFVLARHKGGWDKLSGSYFRSFSNDEFVPCMVSGNKTYDWEHLNITIIGDQHTYNIEDFEIMKGSEVEIQNLINLYLNLNKYNI